MYFGDYSLYAGKWGYLHYSISNLGIWEISDSLIIPLEVGYQDDFIFDQEWIVSGQVFLGQWERGAPIGTTFLDYSSNPEIDMENDLGNLCFVTGNGGGEATDDCVHSGFAILKSPIMDMTNFDYPILSYSRWFFDLGVNSSIGGEKNLLEIKLTNGQNEIILETIEGNLDGWSGPVEHNLQELNLALTDSMRIIFETKDTLSFGLRTRITEAAIDAFLIKDFQYPMFVANSNYGCAPLIVEFNDFSDSTLAYHWEFQGGNPETSNLPNPIVTYDSSGFYPVTLEVTTQSGNSYSISRSNFIEVIDIPIANFNVVNSSFPYRRLFYNESTYGTNYYWDFSNGFTSEKKDVSTLFWDVGVYPVILIVENECGVDSLIQLIEIDMLPPSADFSADTTKGCGPITVTFSNQSTGSPGDLSWSFAGGDPPLSDEPIVEVTYTEMGSYSVVLNVSNDFGNDTKWINNYINVDQVPEPLFVYFPESDSIIFDNLTEGDSISYFWDFGDNSSSIEINPIHTYTESGVFIVTLTATNECGSESFSRTLAITDLESLDKKDYQLLVAPNPFLQEVVVKYSIDLPFNSAFLNVHNIYGQQIEKRKLEEKRGKIELGNSLSPGLYFLRLEVDDKIGTAIKIVKIE